MPYFSLLRKSGNYSRIQLGKLEKFTNQPENNINLQYPGQYALPGLGITR